MSALTPQVSATDPECGTNSPVTYKMARMQASPKEFRVNANSGAICIRSELDYEVASSYQFQVEATDSGLWMFVCHCLYMNACILLFVY